MARITHVKSAQQRYATVPVIDPATGQQKVTPVMKGGQQKVTKRGKPVFLRVTKADKSKPLPNLRCDFPGCTIDGGEIKPGTAYMHISPKSGPYGGTQRNRHAAHPSWNVWDYSYSINAQAQRIAHDAMEQVSGVESTEDVESILSSAADEIRELAEQRRESASNIEDGFGHATYQSEQLESDADELESWADEVEGTDVPELPEPEATDCDECDGTGTVDGNPEAADPTEREVECSECGGTGQIDNDEPTDEQMDDWRSEVEDALSVLDECPV
jgi:hypothetical protein